MNTKFIGLHQHGDSRGGSTQEKREGRGRARGGGGKRNDGKET